MTEENIDLENESFNIETDHEICIKFLHNVFMKNLVYDIVKKNDGVFSMEKFKETVFETPLKNHFLQVVEEIIPFSFFSQDCMLKFLENKISNDPNFISEIEEGVQILNSYLKNFDERFQEIINDLRVK